MYAVYTFNNDKKVKLFLWNDILKGLDFRTSTEGYIMKENGEYDFNSINIKIEKEEDGRFFFEYANQKKFLDDFDYMTVNELIAKINSSSNIPIVTQSEILATFMKDTDNVGILMQVSPLDQFALSFGIGIYSPNVDKDPIMLCVPTERRHNKTEWSYKITFEVENEYLRDFYASKEFYFSDLASLLCMKDKQNSIYKIQLVNKNDYLKKTANNTTESLTNKRKTLLFNKKRK